MASRLAQVRQDSDPPSIRSQELDFKNASELLETRPPTRSPEGADAAFVPLDPTTVDEVDEVSLRLQTLQESTQRSSEETLMLDLPAIWRQAHQSAREYLNAEETYLLSAISLLIEQHAWDPRLFNDTSATFNGDHTDGDVESAVSLVNELRVTKKLPNGGDLAARWLWNAAEDLRSRSTGQYTQSSSIVLDASIPLLRGAGAVARESLIQSQRNLVYAARDFERFRQQFLVDIARDYFSLLQQRQSIANTESRLASDQWTYERVQAQYAAGRIAQFDVNNALNQVRSTTANLANQRENYLLSLDRFKVRLGIRVMDSLDVVSFDLSVPTPDVTIDRAVEIALLYRLDLQNETDRLDDQRRAVKNARNNLLPDASLTGSLTFPTDSDEDEGGLVYEPDDTRYSAGATFSLPLDRRNERLQLRQTMIALQQQERAYEQFRDNLIIDVRGQVREIERARFNLLLSEDQVRINERRQEEQRLKADEVTAQQFKETADELLNAQTARDQAVTDLRNSVLDYLVATGQMQVARDGTFRRLDGMTEGGTPTMPDPSPNTLPAPTDPNSNRP